MKHKILFALALLLFGLPAHAISRKSLYLGVDYFSQGLSKKTTTPSGERDFYGTTFYPFFLQIALPVTSSWDFTPALGYTPFARNSPEGKIHSSYMILSLLFTKSLVTSGGDQGLDSTVGPVLLSYTVKGDGGSVRLSNGSSTSSFGIPSSSQTARTVALDLGLAYNFNKRFRTSFDILTEGLLSNDRRTLSLMVGVAYNLFGG